MTGTATASSDLVTREDEGDRLMLRLGKGNGQYAAGVLMDNGWKPFTYLAAVGDVTGDKNPDLSGEGATGPFTVFPGNGKASFLAPTRRAEQPADLQPDRDRLLGAGAPPGRRTSAPTGRSCPCSARSGRTPRPTTGSSAPATSTATAGPT